AAESPAAEGFGLARDAEAALLVENALAGLDVALDAVEHPAQPRRRLTDQHRLRPQEMGAYREVEALAEREAEDRDDRGDEKPFQKGDWLQVFEGPNKKGTGSESSRCLSPFCGGRRRDGLRVFEVLVSLFETLALANHGGSAGRGDRERRVQRVRVPARL